MFTRKALEIHINDFLKELIGFGLTPTKAVLFESYAKGNPHFQSDIDLAIWHPSFSAVNFIDFEPFVYLVSKYHPIQLHTFNSSEELDPFTEDIMATGRQIHIKDLVGITI